MYPFLIHFFLPVPRLVAIQGLVEDGLLPIYRHPIDASPPLQTFSPTIAKIRDVVGTYKSQSIHLFYPFHCFHHTDEYRTFFCLL